MTFDYKTLKQVAGQRLGNWKEKAVFAASAAQLQSLGTGAFYILYDDDNKIVTKIQNEWMSYGEVSESGNVSEYGCPRRYSIALQSEEVATVTYAPGYDRMERPTGDVKLGIDVEATLKKARKMTVADLLEGFNFG